MILIDLDDSSFIYDITTLVKEFFPKQEITTDLSETCEFKLVAECFNIIHMSLYKKSSEMFELVSEISEEHEIVSDRKERKNILKRTLYRLLSEYTHRKLPWGTLTGIRPVKIPVHMIEEGKSIEEIREYLKDTYYISEEKNDLSIEIAKTETRIMEDINYRNGYSVYIGIPFCPSTCLYCSFTSYPISLYREKVDKYIDALSKEIEYTSKALDSKILNSIYIGGGTPTTLEANQLDRLLTKVREKFDFTNVKEFTVEAGRPDSITREKLEVLKKHNVSRISINPQTMKQETLDIIGRKHTVSQVIEAYELARSLGFDNINMDFIVGLPGEDIEDVRATMEKTMQLKPDSITVHSLALKRAARLNIFKEHYENYSFENNLSIMELTREYADKMGLKPYYLYRQKNMAGNMENVGYAREGCEGIYNMLIMEEKQTILALGAGASSKMVFPDGERIERVENVKNVDIYIDKVDEMIERKRSFLAQNRQINGETIE